LVAASVAAARIALHVEESAGAAGVVDGRRRDGWGTRGESEEKRRERGELRRASHELVRLGPAFRSGPGCLYVPALSSEVTFTGTIMVKWA
jgi:hypothetical protein